LRLALTHHRFLFWRASVIGIHTFLGLHDPRACGLASCHNVSNLQAALSTHLFWGHHLMTLAEFVDEHNSTPAHHYTTPVVQMVR
jgi:hypothetical protein